MKQVAKHNGEVVDVRTFTYQKVKVPKAAVNMVMGQQRFLATEYLMQYYPGILPGIAAAHV